MRIAVNTALVFALAIGAVSAIAAEGPVPGTRVTLDPPDGFIPSEQYPGYEQPDILASIVVSEIPGPVDRVSSSFTEAGLANQGMTLLGTEDTTIDGRDARLVHATQKSAGTAFEKWLAVFGDDEHTVIVVATAPQPLPDGLGPALKRSVLSARWDPSLQISAFEGLPFRVTETASLKVAKRISNSVLLTEGGTDGPVAPADPLLVVATSLGEVQIDDIRAFARKRLSETAELVEVASLEGALLSLNGLSAYEITVDAADHKSGQLVTVYQLLAVEGERYFLIQGLVGRERAEEFLPQFREVARSLQIVP